MVNSLRSKYLLPSLLFAALVLVWHYVSAAGMISRWIVPTPGSVVRVFIDYPDLILSHLKPTIYASVSGLIYAVLIGVITAILMHGVSSLKKLMYPYLIVSQTVPIFAVAPLIVIWFGYGISAKVFTVALVCFFPITMGLYDGLRMVSQEQLNLLKSMGATRWQQYRILMIPASLPAFFTGIKLAATYSVMGAIIGEWLGGNSGLGIYMTRATKSFQTAHVYAVIILTVMLSMSLFGIVLILERRLLRWKYVKRDEYLDIDGIKG